MRCIFKQMDFNTMIEDIVEKKVKAMLEGFSKEEKKSDKRFAYNFAELADYLGCSKSTISRWKSEGKLKGCFKQIDSSVIFDLDRIDAKFCH